MISFILFLFFQQMSLADCSDLDIQANPSYFEFADNHRAELTITVSKNNSHDECDFFIGFGNGGGSSSNRRGLRNGRDEFPVQFWRDQNRSRNLKDFPEATSEQDVIAGRFIKNGPMSHTFSFTVEVDDHENFSYGDYQDKFNIRLYENRFHQNPRHRNNCNIHLVFRRPRFAHVSLVDTGAPFNFFDHSQTLDFADLTPGKSLSCDAVIIYNAGFKLWFKSNNEGRLKRQQGPPQYIPYSMRVNGNLLNWPNNRFLLVDSRHGASPPGGRRYDIDATIENLGSASAGNYWDEVLIRVESLE